MAHITSFLKEVRSEMTKVSWPTKSQLVSYTLVVLGMSLGMAIYLGLLDAVYKFLLDKFIL